MAARTTRTTRRRDTPPPIRTAVTGLLVILGLLVLGWQALRVYSGVPGRDYTTVYVSTPEVGNLLTHDPVRIAGANVGQVLDRDVGADGRPRIELQINPGVELPADTTVAVRGLGLLGARYVELLPGDSEAQLAAGTTIKGDERALSFGVSEAMDTFDRQTRGALGSMITGLGEGLLGHGEKANDGIRAAGMHSADFNRLASSILRRDGAARRLVPSLTAAVRPLDAEREQLSELTVAAADAVEPFADRKAPLREALGEAPSALATARAGLAAGTGLVSSLRAAAVQADRTLDRAPEGLEGLTATLREGRTPLRRASALLEAAGPAIPGVLRITDALQPLTKPVTDMLDDLSPTLRHVGDYKCDIVNFGTVFRSMTGWTQPGEGPVAEPQAFRLQIVMPVGGEIVGLTQQPNERQTREGVVRPCKYLAKPYTQLLGGTGR